MRFWSCSSWLDLIVAVVGEILVFIVAMVGCLVLWLFVVDFEVGLWLWWWVFFFFKSKF